MLIEKQGHILVNFGVLIPKITSVFPLVNFFPKMQFNILTIKGNTVSISQTFFRSCKYA